MDNISKKTENDIADIEKPHSFEKKDLQVTWKNPNDLEKLHPDFSERREERLAGHVGVSCQNLVCALENYSNFKNNFHLTMGVFLK